ncbi:DUF1002 domain-containing protein [Allofustis seminis]|uniref:DUF1002 domain-containing protein n=1 Tax=Allofustis seminis TaxID=166939 RepID=UPI00035DE00B|nr:DUF1002 domain-containing protein [Allofustis seminis]
MKQFLKKIIIAAASVGMLANAGLVAHAVDTQWDKPTVIYGAGLSEAEKKETAVQLGMDKQEVLESVVTGKDLEKYLGYATADANMISSVAVKRTGKGGGVTVNIATPKNITLITKEQYMNAAFTAGIENADIQVAAIRPVTGESALTGVYKAFEENGEHLESNRMAVAQEELETTSDIAQTLDKDQAKRLDAAIVEIKQQLADLKKRTDELATREDIEKIINDALDEYDLSSILTEEQMNRLIALFEKYQQTSAIDSDKIKEQLGNLKDKLGKVWKEAEESGVIDRIVQFLRDIWNAIMDAFHN